jgi:hypothetical protein
MHRWGGGDAGMHYIVEGGEAYASCEESRMNHVGRRRVCIIERGGGNMYHIF